MDFAGNVTICCWSTTIVVCVAGSRTSNLHGAFAVSRLKPFRLPLIVDDVITTGETRNELTKALEGLGSGVGGRDRRGAVVRTLRYRMCSAARYQ